MRFISSLSTVVFSWYIAGSVYAADLNTIIQGPNSATNDLQKTFAGTGGRDAVVIIVNILNYLLGLLGLLFVALLIYGGYKWMMSGGKEDDTKEAKNIIKNALIGCVVILFSWAIAYFVIKTTSTKFLK